MKKLVVLLAALGIVFGGAASASAAKPTEPGREHGRCTAYFNGQKTGHDDDGSSRQKPFQELEAAGSAYDAANGGNDENLVDEQQIEDDVFEYCNNFGIGGNPEKNGRYDCRTTDEKDGAPRDSDTDLEVECIANGPTVV